MSRALLHHARHLLLVALLVPVTAVLMVVATLDGPQAGATATAAVVTLSASTASAVIAGSVTFTATIGGVSPTGTVGFLADGTPLTCGGTDIVSVSSTTTSTATCTVPIVPGPPGVESITALYGGDSANLPASGSIEETVLAETTSTSLSSSEPSVAPNLAVTYEARIGAAGSTAVSSGTVVFSDDGTSISACGGPGGVAVSAGTAQCPLVGGYPTDGARMIEATYSGTSSLAVSQSSPLVETVSATGGSQGWTSTSTTLTSSSPAPEIDAR